MKRCEYPGPRSEATSRHGTSVLRGSPLVAFSSQLFALRDWIERMSGIFIATVLEDLMKMSQPLLVDDLNLFCYEMASVDIYDFFGKILPQIVDSMSIDGEKKVSVLQAFDSSDIDSISFRNNCENFLSEFRYWR